MNDTQKEIKETKVELKTVHKELDKLHRLILGLNAYGSLDLTDYNLILDSLHTSFNYNPREDEDE
ncbi:hypothetical protein [Sulfurimonas sp.]|uniref:hypothetical protein n=1 Tax=Sulfurimonas sp. TaxID=2022749 RepID=UPI003D0EDCEC